MIFIRLCPMAFRPKGFSDGFLQWCNISKVTKNVQKLSKFSYCLVFVRSEYHVTLPRLVKLLCLHKLVSLRQLRLAMTCVVFSLLLAANCLKQ